MRPPPLSAKEHNDNNDNQMNPLDDPTCCSMEQTTGSSGQRRTGPIHPPHNTVQSSCPLCRKAPPKDDVSTPMLHSWDGVLGLYSSFFFLQTRRVEFIPKSYILVSSDHMTFSHTSSGSSRWSLANFRRAWTCAGLSRGTLCALQDFNP